MKTQRGKPKFVEQPWDVINECAYSSTDASTHNHHMLEARYAAEAIAMGDANDDLVVLKRRAEFMAYYIVQVQCNVADRNNEGWVLRKK